MQIKKGGQIAMQKTKRAKENEKKWSWGLTILALPAFVWFLIFSYIPMFGLVIAFKKFDYRLGIFGSKWNGLDNFKYLFGTNDAIRIVRNTIAYNIAFIIVGTICAVTVAIILDNIRSRKAVKLYQTTMFLPYFVSWVVVAYIAQGLFEFKSGTLNGILRHFGKEIMWYSDMRPWPVILILANLWKSIGFNTIMYYGAIMGIDDSLYEAAKIDGAGKWKQITKITLPMLKPTVIILFLLSVGNMMRADFGLFYYVPNNTGALYAVTDVMDTYIYKAIKVTGDITGSAAASFFQSVVGFVLVIAANAIVKKVDEQNAMF